VDEFVPAEKKRGSLIVVEGIDGSGSTTQIAEIRQYLLRRRQKPVFTKEPSDGPAGMLIRLALEGRLLGPNYAFHDPAEQFENSGTALDPTTLALLFAADRADHVASQVEPNLARGRDVICDRYILSSLAYQGLTSSLDWLVDINRHVLRPDLTFFLDVPPQQATVRMRQTRWKRDLYELPEQQRKIRERYLELIERDIPIVGPVVVVDAARPQAEVAKHIQSVLGQFLATGRVDEAKGELTLL
jgi:dTMP kinase